MARRRAYAKQDAAGFRKPHQMELYVTRPKKLRHIGWKQFWTNYTSQPVVRNRAAAGEGMLHNEAFVWDEHNTELWVCYECKQPKQSVFYLLPPRPSEPEFYLWLCLKFGSEPWGLKSTGLYDDNGEEYKSYKDAAYGNKLVEVGYFNEMYRVMEEAVQSKSNPNQLRSLMAICLLNDISPMDKALDDFLEYMMDTAHEGNHVTTEKKRHFLFTDLEERLSRHGKGLADYGMGYDKTGETDKSCHSHTISSTSSLTPLYVYLTHRDQCAGQSLTSKRCKALARSGVRKRMGAEGACECRAEGCL